VTTIPPRPRTAELERTHEPAETSDIVSCPGGLYARLFWEPDQQAREVVRDWCQTVFAEAAAPMVDY